MLNRFQKIFTKDSWVNLQLKWKSKIQLHHAHLVTLPSETSMSAKQAINDKLQGSAATYLRCGEVVNNQIKRGLLLSL